MCGGGDEDADLLPQGLTDIISPFPFENFHGQAESLELVFGDTESTFSPDCWLSDKKQCFPFLLTLASRVLVFEQRAAGSEFVTAWRWSEETKGHPRGLCACTEEQLNKDPRSASPLTAGGVLTSRQGEWVFHSRSLQRAKNRSGKGFHLYIFTGKSSQ